MRFLELRLKPFGRFEDETIRFSPHIQPGGGFHMIIGPNEAGKSTTLAAFERFLFGFPKKDIYNILRRKNLWVGADLELTSGETIGLWRKNSQTNSLLGENQKESRPAGLLEGFLNPIDSKTYMKLFGLNQDTLREGGKKLVSGEGEFADILFGESLGDLQQFDKIRVALKKDADELFKQDGRSRTPLNSLRTKIDELANKIQESVTRTSVWTDLETGRNAVQQELNRIESEITELNHELAAVQNRIVSRDQVDLLKQMRQQLGPLAALPRISENLPQELARATTKLAGAVAEIESTEELVQKKQERLPGIEVRQSLLEHGESIATLADSASAIDEQRMRVVELSQEIEKLRLELRHQASELGLDADQPKEFPQFDQVTKRQIENLGHEIKSLQEELKQDEIEQKRLDRELNRLRQESQGDSFSESQLASVNALIVSLRRIMDQESQLPEIRKQWKRSQTELDGKLKVLPLWSGGLTAFEAIKLPAVEAVEIAERHLREADKALLTAHEKWSQLRFDVQEKEKSIAKRREQLTLPSLEELLSARQERDQAWADIDARWRQSVDLPVHEKAVQSNLFTQLVKNADRMADQLRDRAELVTEMLQLESLRAQRDTAQERLADAEKMKSAALATWQSFWGFLHETPVDPATVRPWLTIGPVVDQFKRDIASKEAQATEIQSLWPAFRDQLAGHAMADLIMESPTAEIAYNLLSERRDAIKSQGVIESNKRQNLVKIANELATLTQEKSEKKARLEEKEESWREVLRKNTIAERITPNEFSEFASSLGRFHQESRRCGLYVETRQALIEKLSQFDQDVHKIAEGTAFREDADSTTVTIRRLNEAVGIERDKKVEIAGLEQEIREAQAKLARLSASRIEYESTVQVICLKIGVELADHAEERFGQIALRNSLETQINHAKSILAQLRGEVDLENWIEAVEAESLEEAEASRTILRESLTEKDQRKTDLLKELGAWNNQQNEIEKRVGQARSLEVRNQQSLLVETTNQQIRNYLKAAMTNRILEEAAQDYRKRMGDDVLNTACLYFKSLSLGSFDGIRPVPNETGGNQLVAVRNMDDPDSAELELNELSEGTRDQLYLALKLAMIRNRLVGREKLGQARLPVILDDILVQFDDERSAAAFRLLGELSEMTQVIFLTHHAHLEQVARSAFGERPFGVHRLAGS